MGPRPRDPPSAVRIAPLNTDWWLTSPGRASMTAKQYEDHDEIDLPARRSPVPGGPPWARGRGDARAPPRTATAGRLYEPTHPRAPAPGRGVPAAGGRWSRPRTGICGC